MNDARHVLESLGIPVAPPGHHHVSGGGTGEWIGVDCDLCSPGSGRFRMGLKFPTTATCHICGPQKLWEVLKNKTGLPFRELRGKFDGCFYGDSPGPAANRSRIAFKAPPGVGRLSAPFRRYLRSRGVPIANAGGLFGVRGIGPAGGRLAYRLFIPIRCGWETVSFTTRSINPDEPRRYISASADQESVPHKSLLYGAELATHAIVINEGPLEAISLGPGGVATCGMVVSSSQVEKMARFPVRVVVANNEPMAVRRAEKLVADLEVYEGKTYLVVPSGKDLLSSPVAERHKLIRRFLT